MDNQRILNKIKREILSFFFQVFKDIKMKKTILHSTEKAVGSRPLSYTAAKTASLRAVWQKPLNVYIWGGWGIPLDTAVPVPRTYSSHLIVAV